MDKEIIQRVKNSKQILIVGDSGRGKTTFGDNLSKKLKIKHYSTDDFDWKVKFNLPHNRKHSIKQISKIYKNKSWIMDGSTRHLIAEGIKKSDLIFYLGHKNILVQFWVLFKRYLKRDEENILNYIRLCRHLFIKRYKLGRQRKRLSVYELISKHKHKVIELYSFKEIDRLVEKI